MCVWLKNKKINIIHIKKREQNVHALNIKV